MDDLTASDSESEQITRAVLTRRRSIISTTGNPSSTSHYYHKSPYNASRESVYTQTSVSPSIPQLKLQKPLLSDTRPSRQTRVCQIVEMFLMLVPVLLSGSILTREQLWTEKLGFWTGIVLVTVAARRKRVEFPETLYLLFFPPLIALATGHGKDLLDFNLVLALTALPLPMVVIETLAGVLANQDDLLLVVCLPRAHAYLCQVIEWTCSTSVTYVEVSLFASVLLNTFHSLFTTMSYSQLVTIIPLLGLLAASPQLEKLTVLSQIMGHHRRPANAAALKEQYAFKSALLFAAACAVLFLSFLGKDDANDMIKYVFYSPVHLSMLAYWAVVLTIAIPIVAARSANWQLDLRRKVWHGVVVAMFLPTISIDAQFCSMCMCIAIMVFVLLEVVRATAMPPFGASIHQFLLPYTDPRDLCGPIIVSHLFLLLGISLPVTLCNGYASPAGVICLGLGDASASIIGRRYGKKNRKYWIGHPKTLEGTLSFMIMVCLGLQFTKYMRWDMRLAVSLTWGKTVAVAASTALLEATSGMNDNVIVPLYMLIMLETLLKM